LVAREEKERAVELPLVSLADRQAVFEGPEYNVGSVLEQRCEMACFSR